MVTTATEPPKALYQAVRALNNHLDGLYVAIKEHQGVIALSEEHQATIRAMKKAGLIYVADELDGFMVNGVVARLIRHFDEKGRLQQTSYDVAKILQKIEQAIELHQLVSKKSSDKQFAWEVNEAIYELSEVLLMICHQFSVQVYEYMASIADIEARIRFNQSQIQELKRLNDIFGGQLSLDRLGELGLFYGEFAELTQKMLMPILDKCRRELVSASSKLNEELLRFKKELKNKQTDDLIHVWRDYFRKNSRLDVNEGLLLMAPQAFFGASLSVVAYAGWGGLDDEMYLQLAQKCTPTPKVSQKTDEIIAVKTVDEQIDEQESPVFERVRWFFEYVAKCGQLDAQSAFDKLGVGEYIQMDDWLLLLANHCHLYQDSLGVDFVMSFDGEPLTNYDGTLLVYNLTVSA